MYRYPLHLKFHLIALASRLSITDANSKEIFYIEQKAFKLKEEITIYNNSTKEQALFYIKTQQVIDFGAEYIFTKADTNEIIGSIQQEGLQSVIKATYHLKNEKGNQLYTISETNPWIKLFDLLMDIIPFIQFLSGYLFHPKYAVKQQGSGEAIMTLEKKPSFFESNFEISVINKQLDKTEETRILLAFIMMILLERMRG